MCGQAHGNKDAGPIRIVELMTSASTCSVVSVYQRPYSWDEENCGQSWEDIRGREAGKHPAPAVFVRGEGRTRQGCIFCARSLRKRASGLKSGADFPVWAVRHPASAQVGGPRIRARVFGAR